MSGAEPEKLTLLQHDPPDEEAYLSTGEASLTAGELGQGMAGDPYAACHGTIWFAMRLPEIIAAADWSVSGERRRVVTASLAPDGTYLAGLPEPVGPPEELIPWLRTRAGPQGVAFIGFDFPIGLPIAYARKAGLSNFREALELFGRGDSWHDFFQPTDQPTIKRPFGPVSNAPEGLKRTELAELLGLSLTELLRRCDHKTPTRQQAEVIFYTRFAKQVGRAAAHAWQHVIQPQARDLRIWPFDGPLATLLNEPGVVVAEIYPAEAVTHLGLRLGPGTGRSKGRREDRAAAAEALIAAAREAGLHFTSSGRDAISGGFEQADDFDAVVALVSIVMVLRGLRPADPPSENDILMMEGWILGLESSGSQAEELAPRVWVPTERLAPAQRPPYYIRQFRWGPGPRETLTLAHPTSGDRGALNVICGLNNTGKSFLLDQLRRLLQGRAHVPAFALDPPPRGRPRLLVLGRAWDAKDKIGIINLEQRRSALDLPQKYGDYRRVGLTLLASHMADHIRGVPPSEAVSHLLEPSVRQQILDAFPPEKEIFRCRPDPLIQRLEAIFDAHLYFRCAKRDPSGASWQFEFVLLDADGNTVPYSEWSEGQKACFCVLTSLDLLRPEIVLFDEVENHLHPAYMTDVLDALRAQPVQSIVATHHPHLIFSRFVDRVFYVETRRPGRRQSPPPALPYSKRRPDVAFSREAKHLVHDLQRITAAYGLFAEHDDLLLRTSIDAKSRATLTLLDALGALFQPHAVGPTPRSAPDTQTQQLAALIQSFASRQLRESVTILDLGAGVGRQVMELGKLSEWQLGARVAWTCYEPFEGVRSELKERLAAAPWDVRIVDSLADLDNQLFDFCVLANVLHELTPPEFVHYMEAADRLTDHDAGGIVILELFPLTKPEGFAVPYEGGLLRDTLDASGFLTDASVTPLRMAGIAAHWVIARRRQESVPVSREVLEEQIRLLWDRTLARSLSAYALRQAPTTLDRYQSLLSNLTTIASIAAWRQQKWSPSIDALPLP